MRLLGFLIPFLFIGFAHAADYSRAAFGSGWTDTDKDCLNSRMEILISDSVTSAKIADCRVVSGMWVDPYTAEIITDSAKADIDHIVPLKEAWLSGADKWTKAKRVQFANDPENLMAVTIGANRSKGHSDPAEWMPPNSAYWPKYLKQWTYLKNKCGLTLDPSEVAAISHYAAMETGKAAPTCAVR